MKGYGRFDETTSFSHGKENIMDRTTKILLAAIAAGLLMNALNPWIKPSFVKADSAQEVRIVGVEKYAFSSIKPIPVKVDR